jgi:hypothetical protein
MASTSIKGLPLPPLLLQLLNANAWKHPGDAVLAEKIPFLREPVDFLVSIERMRRESSTSLAEEPKTAAFFRMAFGSKQSAPVELPWLDVELSIFVAVNRELGADLAIALDYRTSREDPRVVASDFWSAPGVCLWQVAAPTFSDFVAQLGLRSSSNCNR